MCEVVEDGEGGHGEDALFLHQADGLIAQLRGVIDGSYAGLRCVQRSGFAHGVHRDNRAKTMRFFNRGGQLRGSVLVRRAQDAVNHVVGAGLVDLREVGALLVLLSHHFDNLLGGVGVVGIGEHVLRGIVAIGIFVSAQQVDGVAADAQARPGNKSLVDGVANGGIGGSCAFRAHIALGGEAGHHIVFGSLLGEDRAPGHRLDHGLQVFGAGMQEQMNMGIDHAGHQRGVAQIDDLGACGMFHARSDGANAMVFDKNFAGLQDRTGVDLKQPRSVQHDGVGLSAVGAVARRPIDETRPTESSKKRTQTQSAESNQIEHGYEYAASGRACRWDISQRLTRLLQACEPDDHLRRAMGVHGIFSEAASNDDVERRSARPVCSRFVTSRVPPWRSTISRETQRPSPVPDVLLGRKERLEDALLVFVRDAGSVVLDRDRWTVRSASLFDAMQGHDDCASDGDRVGGIGNEIGEDLLELVFRLRESAGICQNDAQCRIFLLMSLFE